MTFTYRGVRHWSSRKMAIASPDTERTDACLITFWWNASTGSTSADSVIGMWNRISTKLTGVSSFWWNSSVTFKSWREKRNTIPQIIDESLLKKTKNFTLPRSFQLYIEKHFAMVFRSLSFVHNRNSARPHWNVPYPSSSRATTIPFQACLLRSSFWKNRPACSLRPIWNRWIDVVSHSLWTYANQSSRQSVGNSPIQCRCHWTDPLCQFYCFWTQYFGRSVWFDRTPFVYKTKKKRKKKWINKMRRNS